MEASIKNFITEDEQKDLLSWAFSCRTYLTPNGLGRFFNQVENLDYNKNVEIVSDRVLESYGLANKERQSGILGTVLSFNEEGGAIHSHNDIVDGYSHLRFNLFLSVPEKGGVPIYNHKKLYIEERILIPYEADKYLHSSTPVKGSNPRIVLGFGWLFNKDVEWNTQT